MESQDIRWKQRFTNFSKAVSHLEDAVKIQHPDFTQKAGIIQLFEMSFELAWNLLKDYLEEQGFADIKSPRTALKKAFEIDLIKNGHIWMELLNDRNLTAHTYDEEKAEEVGQLIHFKYFPLLNELKTDFQVRFINE